MEQHAERYGLDSGRLENLRVAASKSSPMGDTLDLCARYADAAALGKLVPAVCQLLKRGVGVNTRVGSARFVAALLDRMGSDIRPHTGTLLKVCNTMFLACVRKMYTMATSVLFVLQGSSGPIHDGAASDDLRWLIFCMCSGETSSATPQHDCAICGPYVSLLALEGGLVIFQGLSSKGF